MLLATYGAMTSYKRNTKGFLGLAFVVGISLMGGCADSSAPQIDSDSLSLNVATASDLVCGNSADHLAVGDGGPRLYDGGNSDPFNSDLDGGVDTPVKLLSSRSLTRAASTGSCHGEALVISGECFGDCESILVTSGEQSASFGVSGDGRFTISVLVDSVSAVILTPMYNGADGEYKYGVPFALSNVEAISIVSMN